MPALAPRSHPPILFSVGRHLEKQGVPGSSFFLRVLKRSGMLRRSVLFPLTAGVGVEVPISRTAWDAEDLAGYESEFIADFAAIARKLPAPVTLMDVGADIGLFSLKLISACPAVDKLIAFEPNPEGCAFLKRNLARLPFPAEAIGKGVADVAGRGRLVSPGQGLDHAANFMESSEDGPIATTTLDSCGIRNANLCLKIDVEGSELAVLRGAEQTIRTAHAAVIGLEAHPAVVQRTGIDPVECMRVLESWRPFSFSVPEAKVAVDTRRAVFEQIPRDRTYNIIATSGL